MRTKENIIRRGRKRKEYSSRKSIMLVYGLGALGLVLLITAAFLGPKMVFAIQDDIRCRAMVAMSPEEVDITSFNTGYETDLYRRLNRFATGLAEEEKYYVTVQDMELTSEVADMLASENGFSNQDWEILVWSLGLLPYEVFDYNLVSWKRCVIYGDDFAGGVNFILWYIELGNNEKTAVRLLLDGETGEIYGVRTNFDAYFEGHYEGEIQNTLVYSYPDYEDTMWDFCIILGDTYGALDISDRLRWLYSMGFEITTADDTMHMKVPDDYEVLLKEREQRAIEVGKQIDYDWVNKYSIEDIQDFMQRLQWRVSEDGNCLDFYFPYDRSSLNFRIQLDGKIRWQKNWDSRYMDITFGFPEIYERITAFMADWS